MISSYQPYPEALGEFAFIRRSVKRVLVQHLGKNHPRLALNIRNQTVGLCNHYASQAFKAILTKKLSISPDLLTQIQSDFAKICLKSVCVLDVMDPTRDWFVPRQICNSHNLQSLVNLLLINRSICEIDKLVDNGNATLISLLDRLNMPEMDVNYYLDNRLICTYYIVCELASSNDSNVHHQLIDILRLGSDSTPRGRLFARSVGAVVPSVVIAAKDGSKFSHDIALLQKAVKLGFVQCVIDDLADFSRDFLNPNNSNMFSICSSNEISYFYSKFDEYLGQLVNADLHERKVMSNNEKLSVLVT